MKYTSDDKINNVSKCPVTECKLMKPGCKLAYDGENIEMSSTSPFNLATKVNLNEGFDEKVCIVCSNYIVTNG